MADDFDGLSGELERLKRSLEALSCIKDKVSERYNSLKVAH